MLLEVVNNSVLEISPLSGQTQPYIVPTALSSATVGTSYSITLNETGGDPAHIQYSVSGGSLPPGLVLNSSTGAISGQPSSSAGSPYNFQITATDTASGYASQPQNFSLVVTGSAPSGTAITISTNPAGLTVVVDGTSLVAPQTLNLSQGTHTISVTTPQAAGTGTQQVFTAWSDSGAISHSITVGTSAATYTASFQTQYYLTTSAGTGGTITPASGWYNSGTLVTVSASANTGYLFTGFSGSLATAVMPQNLIMYAAESVTANFAPNYGSSSTSNTLAAVAASAAQGATFSIPITLSLNSGVSANAMAFGLQITPAGGAPALTGSLTFTPSSSIANAPFTNTGGTSNMIAVMWSSLNTPLTGASTLGVVSGTVPSGAVAGQTYTVAITGFSAGTGSSNTPIPVSAGQSVALTVALTYMVDDIYPYTSDTAPNFGSGSLNINDLIDVLFTVTSVPGYAPAACSDRFDAMDSFPADTATTRGGDGVLDIRDLITVMFRVNNLDPARPLRTSLGGVCAGTQSKKSTAAIGRASGAAIGQTGALGALTLGTAEKLTATEDRIPLYLEATSDLDRIAVAFALGDRQSQFTFVATPDAAPSLAEDRQPGVVALAWLEGLSLQAGEQRLLGYVNGPSGSFANVRVYGLSASRLSDNSDVRLDAPEFGRQAR